MVWINLTLQCHTWAAVLNRNIIQSITTSLLWNLRRASFTALYNLHVLYTWRAMNMLILFSLLCWFLQTSQHSLFLQLKTAITLASSRDDMSTIRDALEVSAEMYRKDPNNVQDYVQRHLLSLSVWEELRSVMLSMRLFSLELNFLWCNPYVMSFSNMQGLPRWPWNNTLVCHVIQLCFEISWGCLWLE